MKNNTKRWEAYSSECELVAKGKSQADVLRKTRQYYKHYDGSRPLEIVVRRLGRGEMFKIVPILYS
jgi:hypothetical protein